MFAASRVTDTAPLPPTDPGVSDPAGQGQAEDGPHGAIVANTAISLLPHVSPDSGICATLDNLPEDVLVHMLLFLCPPVYLDLQSLDGGNEIDGHMDGDDSGRTCSTLQPWPREALAIALTCRRMHRVLFVDPRYDALFWRWHSLAYLHSIVVPHRSPGVLHEVRLTEEEALRRNKYILRPTGSSGQPDYAQRGVVARDRARFAIPEEQRRIAAVGSDEQRAQPNYYRLLTARHHRLHEKLCQDLQRREDARYRRISRAMFIDGRVRGPVLRGLCTAIFAACLLFYGLQTLRGFLHWLLLDVLQLAWYELPSRILLHVSWLPAWIFVMLLFTLTTLMVLYHVLLGIEHRDNLLVYLAICILKGIFLAVFATLLLLYLAVVLPRRRGDPTWLQPEYIPWNLTTAPLILILLPFAVISLLVHIQWFLSEYIDFGSVLEAVKFIEHHWLFASSSASLVTAFLALAPLAQTFLYDALWWRWASMLIVHIPLLLAEATAIVFFSYRFDGRLKLVISTRLADKKHSKHYVLSILLQLSLAFTHLCTIATVSWWFLIPAAIPTTCAYVLIMAFI